jgi:hypothetical protein
MIVRFITEAVPVWCYTVITVDLFSEIPMRCIMPLQALFQLQQGESTALELEISLYTSQAKTAAQNAKALAERVVALPEYCAGGLDPVVVPLPLVAVPLVTKV